MFENRGQGTTEYLIILAIVIVIALVVVGVLGGFPSIGTGISQGQSKAYWGSVQPLAIVDWVVVTSGANSALVVQNNSSQAITLVRFVWNGVTFTDTNTIAAGGKLTVYNTAITCPTAGQPFSRTLSYRYSTPNLSNIDFNGSTPVVGNCQ